MSAVLKFPEKISLNELAKICLERADGDWRAAADEMAVHVNSDDPLFRELMEPLLAGAVWDKIRYTAGRHRRSFHRHATAPKAPSNDGIKAVSQRWYDYPIYGGVRLGDATKEDIKAAIEGYTIQEQSNRQRREFMERLHKKVPKGKQVRQVLSEDQIERLS